MFVAEMGNMNGISTSEAAPSSTCGLRGRQTQQLETQKHLFLLKMVTFKSDERFLPASSPSSREGLIKPLRFGTAGFDNPMIRNSGG
jgi:hypothetical protein